MTFSYLTSRLSPLLPGDIVPPFLVINQYDKERILWGMAGKPVILFFYSHLSSPITFSFLQSIQQQLSLLEKKDSIEVIGIGFDAPDALKSFAQEQHFSFSISSYKTLLADMPQPDLLRKYGVVAPKAENSNEWLVTPHLFVITQSSTVFTRYVVTEENLHVTDAFKDACSLLPKRPPAAIPRQAPVLLLDNVLSKAECDHLIHIWHTQGHVDSGSMINKDGKTIGVLNYNQKIRKDHFIEDRDLLQHLDLVMQERVFPHILKAFNYQCTRREQYKIACYDAKRGGYFRKHRDNTTAATAHRVWAMSLNLNAEEYEGGYLQFPEFSDDYYKPTTGSAVIFSGALMHEAMDVIKGERFVLLNFFYGEKEAVIRQQNEKLLVTD